MKTSVLGLTLLLASTAGAQPDPGDVPTARVSVCTASVATRASVVQVAQQPDRFMGKCVRIDAVMNGLFLYENVDGLYLSDREGLNPSSNGARLGLDDQRPGRLADRGYRRANVVGRVQDCDTVRSAVHASVGQNEIVMVTGYCHYFYGAYLWVEQARDEGPATFVRRLPGAARDGYGNLQSAPADWLYRSMVEAAGHDFLAALRAGDETTLATLHYGSEVEYAKDDLPSLLRFLLRDRTSPFAAIRASKSAPQTVVLIDRDGIPGDTGSGYESTICYCRERDCTNRWPIADFDVDNLPARPYACTTFGPYLVYRQGQEVRFTTPRKRYGLLEPQAAAR